MVRSASAGALDLMSPLDFMRTVSVSAGPTAW